MKIDIVTLQALEASGVSLVAKIRVPWGSQKVIIDLKDIELFVADRDAGAAKCLGVTLDEYHEWIESGGGPRCGALTKSGKRCRNPVSGGIHMPIEKWKSLNGDRCAVHGGETSEEALTK